MSRKSADPCVEAVAAMEGDFLAQARAALAVAEQQILALVAGTAADSDVALVEALSALERATVYAQCSHRVRKVPR